MEASAIIEGGEKEKDRIPDDLFTVMMNCKRLDFFSYYLIFGLKVSLEVIVVSFPGLICLSCMAYRRENTKRFLVF